MNNINPHKKSFYLFLGITTLILIFTFIFNRFIDPKSYFSGPRIQGVNFYKPQVDSERAILYTKPDVIILGSSRAELGIDPIDDAWSQDNIFNLAFGGANIYDSLHYLEYAHKIHKVKKVILMTDFFMFNSSRKPYSEESYKFLNTIKLNESLFNRKIVSNLISLQTLQDSFATIANQKLPHNLQINNGGRFDDPSPPSYAKLKSTESAFFKVHYRNFYKDSMLSGFDELVAFAHKNNIELVIGISPMHARLLEVISVSGLWDEFEEWKNRMTEILEFQSQQNLQDQFLLFDFANHNIFTTEEAPTINNYLEMKWFQDSSHYNYALGSLIIQRMSNKEISETTFGEIISNDNIDEHLSEMRSKRDIWQRENQWHRDDVRSIRQ